MTDAEEQLREQVSELRSMLARLTGDEDQRTRLRVAFGLSPKQVGCLTLLLNTRRLVTTETMYACVFEHSNGDGPNHEIVKVAVSQVRRRLRDLGAPDGINAAYGTGGYQLTSALRDWVLARLQPQAAAA